MKKTHPIRRLLLLLLLAALVVGLAAMPMLSSLEAEEQDAASILSAGAERRTVSRFLSYGAPLETQQPEAVTVPSGVGVTEYLVSGGDTVQAGDPIARVDRVSVMTAVQQVQQSLETIAGEMKEVRAQITPGIITVDESGSVCVDGRQIEEAKRGDYLQFAALSEQHRVYEQLLLDLFLLCQDDTVTAPCDGMIGDLDETRLVELSAAGAGRVVFLATNTPTGEDDETEYYCYVGKVELVEDGSWLLRRGMELTVADFLNLEGLDLTMTDETRIFDPSYAAVFRNSGGEWMLTTAQAGDIVLIVGNAPWIIVIGSAEPTVSTDPEETKPTAPEETEPTEPEKTEPTEPGEPEQKPGSGAGSGGGGMSAAASRGGTGAEAQQGSLYSTETVQLATVTPMHTMRLTLSVDEADIGQLALGMEAQLSFEALPNQRFTARITGISQFGVTGDGSSKFSVTLELPWTGDMLPGMNAKVKIPLESRDGCLTIPVAALTEQGNNTLVYGGFDEKSQTLINPVTVETGLSDGEYVEILSGLTEDSTVWYRYYDHLVLSNSVEKKSAFG